MLINQHNSNILPLLREIRKGLLDRCVLRFGVDDEEVLLGVGGGRYVLRPQRALEFFLDCGLCFEK